MRANSLRVNNAGLCEKGQLFKFNRLQSFPAGEDEKKSNLQLNTKFLLVLLRIQVQGKLSQRNGYICSGDLYLCTHKGRKSVETRKFRFFCAIATSNNLGYRSFVQFPWRGSTDSMFLVLFSGFGTVCLITVASWTKKH